MNRDNKSLSLLIVDDDVTIQTYLKAMASAAGIGTITTTASVDGTLDAIRDNNINCAIVDLVLQRSSGIEVATIMKSRGIPVVFSTAMADEFNDSQMLELGWILRKPLRLAGLHRAIDWFHCVNSTLAK